MKSIMEDPLNLNICGVSGFDIYISVQEILNAVILPKTAVIFPQKDLFLLLNSDSLKIKQKQLLLVAHCKIFLWIWIIHHDGMTWVCQSGTYLGIPRGGSQWGQLPISEFLNL